MTGKHAVRELDGTWTYPSSEEVLREAGLYTIKAYVEVRRNTILKYIVNHPIFDLCREAGRQRGTSHRRYWWEQPIDLEAARAGKIFTADVAADGEGGA